MRLNALVVLLPALGAQGIRIIQSNDDGWAEQYARSFHNALIAAGHDAVLSAPAENKSGSGSLDIEPSPRSTPCQYDSCPANSGPIGRNETSPRLNWVNSFPATSMRYGIDTIGPQLWNGEGPELAVSGPNVGSNLYLAVQFSGTVGAAVHAAKNAKIPAIAFSGASEGTLAWNSPEEPRSRVYAELAATLTNAVIASGKPYLPEDVFLNVNFPKVEGQCTEASQFKWVLSRINVGLFSAPDTEQCGSTRLPTELSVLDTDGCYISVSVGDANDKTTAPAEKQAVVRDKLKSMLTCLP
ncbi:survival protein sure-likephosphatase/nucleotidase-like protein [Thermothelomyces thermophilus ATCC 42464]|uniref:Survival protein sure-likephosphatase/nucleotidase-like protein n=1 Tax=Thermothelomyces thermophilus (strain ATCC 42464 / BCRC 31852 / DSM 1799) TaxID=573729 RepID=G2QBZ3_THET4|nr:survival protein sure-likephosphatase/nucleotidase-like protein [Thermothelomyces thermophilus ATCC 42464]AEO57220.1 survival protein sure-likephosphatase/nucleotidase-like protein [Thermothelomyces thermophilus ATCC 42464]